MEELPLKPVPEEECGPGIKKALATFGASTLLGFGALVLLAQPTRTQGASRSARLRRIEAKSELERLSHESGASPGSTPSR